MTRPWSLQNYDEIAQYLDFTRQVWPINEYELMKAMEPAMITCCDRDDAHGLHVLTLAAGHLPNTNGTICTGRTRANEIRYNMHTFIIPCPAGIAGLALYKCSMKGHTLSAAKLLQFTTPLEKCVCDASCGAMRWLFHVQIPPDPWRRRALFRSMVEKSGRIVIAWTVYSLSPIVYRQQKTCGKVW